MNLPPHLPLQLLRWTLEEEELFLVESAAAFYARKLNADEQQADGTRSSFPHLLARVLKGISTFLDYRSLFLSLALSRSRDTYACMHEHLCLHACML